MTLREYYDEFRNAIPEAPKWFAALCALYAFLTIPIVVWWDCDFRIFRSQVRIVLRRIFYRIIGG